MARWYPPCFEFPAQGKNARPPGSTDQDHEAVQPPAAVAPFQTARHDRRGLPFEAHPPAWKYAGDSGHWPRRATPPALFLNFRSIAEGGESLSMTTVQTMPERNAAKLALE